MVDRATIVSAVDSAFSAFSGLIQDATLEAETVTGFDWSTNDVTSTVSNSSIEVIPYEVVYDGDGPAIYRYVAKSEGFPEHNYTTLVIGTARYRIDTMERYEGLVVLELRGET